VSSPAERILAVAQTLPNAQQRAELEQSVREIVGDPDAEDRDHVALADQAIRDAERMDEAPPGAVELRRLAWTKAVALVLRAKIPGVRAEDAAEDDDGTPAGGRGKARS
jgi:hypothetical protein